MQASISIAAGAFQKGGRLLLLSKEYKPEQSKYFKNCRVFALDDARVLKTCLVRESADLDIVRKLCQREVDLCLQCSHPNVIQMFSSEFAGTPETGYFYHQVLEFAGKPLKEYCRDNRGLSIEVTLDFAEQIHNGLECIHRNKVIHRDMHPRNIMVSASRRIKIIDFGLSYQIPENGKLPRSRCGIMFYCAPEVQLRKKQSYPVDCYGAAASLCQALMDTRYIKSVLRWKRERPVAEQICPTVGLVDETGLLQPMTLILKTQLSDNAAQRMNSMNAWLAFARLGSDYRLARFPEPKAASASS